MSSTLVIVDHQVNPCLPFLPFLQQQNIHLQYVQNMPQALALLEQLEGDRTLFLSVGDSAIEAPAVQSLSQLQNCRIFLMGAESNPHIRKLLKKNIAEGLLQMPLSLSKLQAIFEKTESTETFPKEKMDRLWKIVGVSPAMQKLCHTIQKVAPTSATVFLIGKSGTGKELVAEAIHRYSRRSKKPYIAMNCGTIPPDLISSALFGHEKGSFTGATQNHTGYFAQAHGGTLFLDEITEASLDFQIKLLRVLETGMIQPVGSTKDIPVDVRIVASTNRSPKHAIKEGKLREDLYYRLSVFPIFTPTLEERPGDKELLAEHFLGLLNESEKASVQFSPAALEKIKTLQYAGNVRELKNMIYRAFILADQIIEAEHIQPASI